MNTEKVPWQKIKKHLGLAMQGRAWPGCYPTYLIMKDKEGSLRMGKIQRTPRRAIVQAVRSMRI